MSAPLRIETADLKAEARGPASQALALAAMGWALLPIAPRTKEPHAGLLPRGRDGRPSWTLLGLRPASAAEILEWFRQEPECGIGVILGEPSGGLVCVDVDHRSRWPRSVALPDTVVCSSSTDADGTWRGHLFYQASAPVARVKWPWGELLADGHYAVIPPSVHPSGGTYGWVDGKSPLEAAIADAPLWVYESAPPTSTEAPSPKRRSRDPKASPAPSNTPMEPRDQTKKQYIVTRSVSVPASSDLERRRGDWPYEELAASEEVAIAILRAVGAKPKAAGSAFKCPLPGHEERHPSAAIWHKPGRPFVLHDFHARSEGSWWTLADVFAAIKTGRAVRLSKGLQAVWWLRALEEVGRIDAPRVRARAIDPRAPLAAKRLYDGFLLLVALRMHYDPGQPLAAPYSWDFAAGWNGMRSRSEVASGMKWLRDAGYLVFRAKTQGAKSGLLSLGPAAW